MARLSEEDEIELFSAAAWRLLLEVAGPLSCVARQCCRAIVGRPAMTKARNERVFWRRWRP